MSAQVWDPSLGPDAAFAAALIAYAKALAEDHNASESEEDPELRAEYVWNAVVESIEQMLEETLDDVREELFGDAE